MKNRISYLAVLFLTVSAFLPLQGVASSWNPGHGPYTGNIFSSYSPSTTYVGIFPGYRQGYYSRSYQRGWSGSAYEQMSTRNNYYTGYYGDRYWRGPSNRGGYYRGYAALPFFMINRGWNRSRLHGEALYTSRNFVEAWKDAERPVKKAPSLEDSPLLTKGMTAEEVVFKVGSPLQKIRMGGREIWKYSSFSLVFDNGMLSELR